MDVILLTTIGPCGDKLLEIASEAICSEPPERTITGTTASPRVVELLTLCERKNGFYVFEAALHVLPACNDHHMGLQRWNAMATWKDSYGSIVADLFCFAEDIFGEQFAICGSDIVSFNPESGQIAFIAATVEDWACRMLTEYELLSGYPFAHEWQKEFRPLREGERLIPKTPFIFGGEYERSNLYPMDSGKAMRLRGDIYRQIRDLPDGAHVKFKVT